MSLKLTPKQERFAQLYIELGNASAAYRKSYDAKKMKPNTVEKRACELLKNGKVAGRIDTLRAKVVKIAEEKFEITETRILAELSRCAFYRADEFFAWSDGGVKIKDSSTLTSDQLAAVQSVSMTPNTGKIEIKLADKLASLDKLARTLGMFKDKTELTGKDGGAIQLENSDKLDLARWIALQLHEASGLHGARLN